MADFSTMKLVAEYGNTRVACQSYKFKVLHTPNTPLSLVDCGVNFITDV